MTLLKKLAIPAATSLLLAACGGGDGGPASSGDEKSTEISFGGITAVGAPLVNASVAAVCAAGEEKTTTDDNGEYQFKNIRVELPCLITATGTHNNQQVITYGMASQPATNVNATTFTTFALQAALGVNSLNDFGSDKLKQLKGKDMTASLQEAWSAVAKDLRDRYENDIFISINPFEKFVPNPAFSEIDEALEIAKDLVGKSLDEVYLSETHSQKSAADEKKREECADTKNFAMGKCWRVTMGAENGYSWINMGDSKLTGSSSTSAWFDVYDKNFHIFKNAPEDETWAILTITDTEGEKSTSSSIEKMTIQACYGKADKQGEIDLRAQTQTLSMVSPNAKMVTQNQWAQAVKKPNGINLFLQKNCIVYGGDINKPWSHEDMAYIKFMANGSAIFYHRENGKPEVAKDLSKTKINDWLFNNKPLEILGDEWFANPFYMTVEEDDEIFDVFSVQLYKKPNLAGSAQVDAAFLVEGEGEYLDY